MRKVAVLLRVGFCAVMLCALPALSGKAQTAHRPPAVPLIANDPYFSVWSMYDKLTDGPTKHWSEAAQPLTGLIRIDGHNFRWMGSEPRRRNDASRVPAMEQKSVEVTPLHSRYVFSAAGIELNVTFFTPSFPTDLDVMSRPVTYLTWQARSADGKPHTVSILLDASPMLAVNDRAQKVTWGRAHTGELNVLRVGSRDQEVLNKSGDRIRVDWGYFNMAVPDEAQARMELSAYASDEFLEAGSLGKVDDLDMPKAAGSSMGSAAHLAVDFPLGVVGANGANVVERHVLLAYTDGYGIEYLGRKLRDYWQRNGMTEQAMLQAAESEYPALEQRGRSFDTELAADMAKVGGPDYAYMTAVLFRHTMAAHKLVADIDGTPFWLSKENDSNGCIDTVDLTYPSAPFFLLFNPKLLQAQLEPLMRYASLPRWRFPFAPHDLGTYPLADGQVYGGGEANEDDQMPVEESGNLLILFAAMGRETGDWSYAKQYMPILTKWAAYLEAKGLDPESQLSTDDFSGHLAHNTNLSIKAIEALGAFAQIARGVGNAKLAEKYERVAKPLPAKWQQMALDGDHYKLAFDQPGTWSQKYNLVWDDVLGMHLFPREVADREWKFYAAHMNLDGLPLDNRATFTKLDWEVWTASLAHDPKDFASMIEHIVHWMDTTPSRVPTTDWYDTISGKEQAFQARSVVGGTFLPALMNKEVAAKWKREWQGK